MRGPSRLAASALLIMVAAGVEGPDLFVASVVRAQTQARPDGADPARPGPDARPAAVAGRGHQEDDRPRRLQRRAGRQRAGHRQPGRHDLRRARPHLDHREPGISRAAAGPGKDRIKVLEDTHGDGKSDKFTVFADGLNIPSGIAVGYGGVWVANSPDILFLQDTRRRRQGRQARGRRHRLRPLRHPRAAQLADLGPRRLALRLERRLQPRPSRLEERQDLRVHLRHVPHPSPDARVPGLLRGHEQPLGHRLDPRGRAFASACVIDHLWHLVETGYYIRQGGPYPPFTWPIESIVNQPPEGGLLRHPLLRQRRLSRRSTAASCSWATSTATASTWTCSSGTARPTAAQPAPDFLTANDAWFMPVSQKTGPDGCLYVLDWYDRYHCYQDANRDPAGIDREGPALPHSLQEHAAARRVRPRQGERRPARSSGCAARTSTSATWPSGCWRSGTRRRSAAKLETAGARRERARARRGCTALWARIGARPAGGGFHAKLLDHKDPGFRAWGVRAAGNAGKVDDGVRDEVIAAGRDPSRRRAAADGHRRPQDRRHRRHSRSARRRSAGDDRCSFRISSGRTCTRCWRTTPTSSSALVEKHGPRKVAPGLRR